MVAEVVLRESVWNTNKAYDYLVPEELSEKIKVGQYIRVPFGNGNRPCVALVMKLKEEAQEKEGARAFRMKSIHSIVEEEPVLNQEQLEILHFLTKRYASTYGSAMHQMVPALVTKRTGRSQLVVSLTSEEKAREAIDSESISSLPQLRALQWLLEVEEIPLSDLMQELSISRSPIDTLAKNGLVTIRSVHFSAEQRAEIGESEETVPEEKQQAHILNPEQEAAVQAILEAKGHKEFLLFGVTGSGKTEVYLQVTEQILKQGGSVLYLVPEISLTPQTVSRIKSRFPEKIAVLHSRLTAKERYDSWKRIQRGEVRIVVGARSAVFAPVSDLKLIIMDEEHDSSRPIRCCVIRQGMSPDTVRKRRGSSFSLVRRPRQSRPSMQLSSAICNYLRLRTVPWEIRSFRNWNWSICSRNWMRATVRSSAANSIRP